MEVIRARGWMVAVTGLLAIAAPLCSATAAAAQTPDAQAAPPVPRYEVHRATSSITVDGLVDESAWESASQPVALRALWEQQTGPRHATAARLLWDDDYLYVSYEVEDADITAQYLERDDPTYRDDAVEIFLNPMPSQTGLYYGLEKNARAVLFDYLMYDSRRLFKRFDMDGVRVATHLDGTLNARGDSDTGWSLEVAIPWDNFEVLGDRPEPGTVWSANLNRWDGIQPDRTMSIWSDPLVERPHPHFPERFGELIFVD